MIKKTSQTLALSLAVVSITSTASIAILDTTTESLEEKLSCMCSSFPWDQNLRAFGEEIAAHPLAGEELNRKGFAQGVELAKQSPCARALRNLGSATSGLQATSFEKIDTKVSNLERLSMAAGVHAALATASQDEAYAFASSDTTPRTLQVFGEGKVVSTVAASQTKIGGDTASISTIHQKTLREARIAATQEKWDASWNAFKGFFGFSTKD